MNTTSLSARRHAGRQSRHATRWSFFGLLRAWIDTAAQRRHLAELDDRMLEDIGVTRDTAKAEAARRFWDLPRSY
ncbi:DUF1127 domain-containing protein [Oceanicella sp. SM1341]|uniref:DUF1127 domain-containing protein n=1 Tax=Oceanicella sp. SM1341 TaxID=1548889 RepID=UPI000E534134|nr:DUF1127 domain-containing protein [Oceanicella sp. SM1341]